MTIHSDPRIVMTLDAGRTGLKFCAVRGHQLIFGPVSRPTVPEDLDQCLANIIAGFDEMRHALPAAPVAISFAFPGPADYTRGIISHLQDFPAFAGDVALGPILQDRFGIPVFINNDGDLFVYGEAIAGFLPYVNGLLEQAGSPKRYHNLFGVTLGTGFGAGIAHNGELYLGDNSAAGEAWLLRNQLNPAINAEEGACIRAVRRVYAAEAGVPFESAPEPKEIFEIGMSRAAGHRDAALTAFRNLGEVAGDAMAQALTLLDGLAVIGGGISAAWPLFLPALVTAMNAPYAGRSDNLPRLASRVFNLEDPSQLEHFLRGEVREVPVPDSNKGSGKGSQRKITFDPLRRTAVGISRLGTSQAVAIGAYAFALRKLGGMEVV